MNACMHDYAKDMMWLSPKGWSHGVIRRKVGTMASFVPVSRVLPSSQSSIPSEFYWMTGQHSVQQRS